jgi:hypothetical protein
MSEETTPVSQIHVFTDTGPAQLAAMRKIFTPVLVPLFEAMVYAMASKTAKNYDGGIWTLVTNEEGTAGFIFPAVDDQTTYDVAVDTNYYTNATMDPVSFGAAVSLTAINHISWMMAESQQNNEDVVAMYYNMRNFVFDLSEGQYDTSLTLNGAEVARYID